MKSRRQRYYLNFGQDGDDGYGDAEDEVEADEDFVLSAVVRLGVVEIEEHHRGKRQCIVEHSEEEETCGRDPEESK